MSVDVSGCGEERTNLMRVPLLDLRAQFLSIKDELGIAIQKVVEAQQFINGPEVKQLEREVAAYCSCKSAIAVSSGTDALLCALMALEIGPGDEVITTPYTFFATAGSIVRTGAKPVFVDIQPDTYNIDVSVIERVVTPRTRAIIPVHLFGQCAEMDPILDVARKHGLAVIEDAAQAIGACYRSRSAGSMGTLGCLSFFPSKNLGGLGDGGMILTQDPQLAERCEVLRQHGSKPKYIHKYVGGNFRLDTLQAAGLLVKLPHLTSWAKRRAENAALYNRLLAGFEPVTCPVIHDYNTSVYNQYVLRVKSGRDDLMRHLEKQGVGTAIYYPLALHEQECFKDLGYRRGDFPESEMAAAQTLAIPIYPELTPEQIEYVAASIKSFWS
jgi:dTDP-4-amino-4,6-dideoxygalactose transaminase